MKHLAVSFTHQTRGRFIIQWLYYFDILMVLADFLAWSVFLMLKVSNNTTKTIADFVSKYFFRTKNNNYLQEK